MVPLGANQFFFLPNCDLLFRFPHLQKNYWNLWNGSVSGRHFWREKCSSMSFCFVPLQGSSFYVYSNCTSVSFCLGFLYFRLLWRTKLHLSRHFWETPSIVTVNYTCGQQTQINQFVVMRQDTILANRTSELFFTVSFTSVSLSVMKGN